MKNSYTPGLHILATFTSSRTLLTDERGCKLLFDRLVKELGLNNIGEVYFSFPNGGFTATICLTESHVAIHTWPEFDRATFDVFLSNFNNDNSEKVRRFYTGTIDYFNAQEINIQEVMR